MDKQQRRQYSKARYQQRKEAGLCAHCPNPRLNNRATCVDCLKRISKSQLSRYYNRREKGVCYQCSVAINGGIYCAKHSEIVRKRHRDCANQKKTKGICISSSCTNPAEKGKARCNTCLHKRQKAYHLKHNPLFKEAITCEQLPG